MSYGKVWESSCSRIYFAERSVIKVLPTSYSDNEIKYYNEVNAYAHLREESFVAELLMARLSATVGLIELQKIEGVQLNCFYCRNNLLSFGAASGKAVLVAKLLIALKRMWQKGIYWNDLSAHNIFVVGSDIVVFDFGEAGPIELHDHIGMLTWLLHDLEKEQPISYQNSVYHKIHMAGRDLRMWPTNRFQADVSFFSGDLSWIYATIVQARTLADIFSSWHTFGDRVEKLSKSKIGFKLDDVRD
jgi:hypothetical protein